MKTAKEIYFDLCDKHLNEIDRSDIVVLAMEEYGKQQYNQAITDVFNKFGDIAELILKLKK